MYVIHTIFCILIVKREERKCYQENPKSKYIDNTAPYLLKMTVYEGAYTA